MAPLEYHYRPVLERREDCLYHEVSPGDVPADIKQLADRVRHEVARSLGLTPPTIRWMPTATSGINGQVFKDHQSEIWVRLRSSEADVVETVSHEVRHLALLRDRVPLETREADASSFGQRVRERFIAGRPLVDAPKRAAPAPAPAPARRAAPPPRAPAPAARPAATTVRRYHAPSEAETAMLERKRRIYTTGGLKWLNCEACLQVVVIGTTHHCAAALAEAKRYRPRGG